MKNKLTLSPSSINTLQSCLRKGQFEKVRGFRGSKSSAMEGGDLYHKLLESYYSGIISKRSDNITSSINDGRAHSISLNLDPKEVERCIKVFRDYCLFYANETWIPLAVEKPFTSEEPIHETENFLFYLEFRTDLLFQDRDSISACDHKSKGKKSYPNPLQNQYLATCYGLGINTLVENVLYTQETMDGSKLTHPDRFPRRIFTYTDEQLEEWRQDIVYLCDSYEKAFTTNFYPRNLTSCDKYGGCQFSSVCSALPEVRDYILSRDFKKSEGFDIFKK